MSLLQGSGWGVTADCFCCFATLGPMRSWGQDLLQTLGWWGGAGTAVLTDMEPREETGPDVAHLCPDPCPAVSWLCGLRHLCEA